MTVVLRQAEWPKSSSVSKGKTHTSALFSTEAFTDVNFRLGRSGCLMATLVGRSSVAVTSVLVRKSATRGRPPGMLDLSTASEIFEDRREVNKHAAHQVRWSGHVAGLADS